MFLFTKSWEKHARTSLWCGSRCLMFPACFALVDSSDSSDDTTTESIKTPLIVKSIDKANGLPKETQMAQCTVTSGDIKASAHATFSKKLEGFCSTRELAVWEVEMWFYCIFFLHIRGHDGSERLPEFNRESIIVRNSQSKKNGSDFTAKQQLSTQQLRFVLRQQSCSALSIE